MQITISRRSAFLVVLTLLVMIPAMALAGTVFDDVDDASSHIDGVTFMKDSGVSVGCDAANNYCPGDAVTRAQMATFMFRLSGNDPATDPSVNAQTLNGNTTGAIASKVLFDASDDMPDTEGSPLTADIEQSTDGFLIVTANLVFANATGSDNWHMGCRIELDGAAITPDNTIQAFDNGESTQCTATVAIPLPAGSHTVDAAWEGGGAGITAGSGSLWGIWVPFSAAGD